MTKPGQDLPCHVWVLSAMRHIPYMSQLDTTFMLYLLSSFKEILSFMALATDKDMCVT